MTDMGQLQAMFESIDEGEALRRVDAYETNRPMPTRRDTEYKIKRMLERSVRRTNHVLRTVHYGTAQRMRRELDEAIESLKAARSLIDDDRS